MPVKSPQSRRRSTAAHQRQRAHLIASTPPGTPCWRCLRPMVAPVGGAWGSDLDADHSTPAAIKAGLPDRLAHRACNRWAGAHLGTPLANVADPDERARICAEVDAKVNAKLRGQRVPTPARQPSKPNRYDDEPVQPVRGNGLDQFGLVRDSPGAQPYRRVSKW